MNALSFALQRASPIGLSASRRAFATSSAAAVPKQAFIPDVIQARTFRQAWFSDPSTYPLIVILGAAGFFIVGAASNCFLYYNDVRINPKIRHQVIRDWVDKPTKSFTEVLAAKPRPLGLGVDPEKFRKMKSESK